MRGLSDDEYESESLNNIDNDEEEDELPNNSYYPHHKLLRDMNEYKWDVATLFILQEEFNEAVNIYAVDRGLDLYFLKSNRKKGKSEMCGGGICVGSLCKEGLIPALYELLPGVDQRFCVRHLYKFRKKLPGLHLKTTYPQEWERAIMEIKNVNESAYQHHKEIPQRFWTKSAFRLRPKCDQLLNNMCETFNAVILKAREKPIVTMLDDIKVYLMEKWAKNRKHAEKLQSQAVLPKIQKRLDKEFQESGKWLSRWAREKKYEVKGPIAKFAVDLSRRECGCRKWMLTSILCAYAISCINHMGKKPQDCIPSYYRIEH
ncbi:Sporozoite surface protein 2 [Senna tora]|uniref:Sporozoite surface protein 2 n=1 Tax=Senna tora TaxID=362788 RepID=A0A834XI51_9FABA|nr:Sporozoite surface protein 2 [Senna tora]